MAKKTIELDGPLGKAEAEYVRGQSVSFYMSTAKITVYKPGTLDDSRADASEYCVTLGRKASDPIPVLLVDELSAMDAYVDKAVLVLDTEDEEE